MSHENMGDDPPSESVSPRPDRRITFRGASISSSAWSPDGNELAVLLRDGTLTFVDISKKRHTRRHYNVSGSHMRWSPNGAFVATFGNREAHVWRVSQGALHGNRTFPDPVSDLTWSPDSRALAIGFTTGAIEILELENLTTITWCISHEDRVVIDWRWDDHLVSASRDLLGIWKIGAEESGFEPRGSTPDSAESFDYIDNAEALDIEISPTDFDSEQWSHIREDFETAAGQMSDGATPISVKYRPHGGAYIASIAALHDGRIATCGEDSTLRIWSADCKLESIYESATGAYYYSVSTTHSPDYLIAADSDGVIHVIDMRTFTLFGVLNTDAPASIVSFDGVRPDSFEVAVPSRTAIYFYNLARALDIGEAGSSTHYRNAKVVLVGDSGVGKSGLSLALSGREFAPTESTHARNVWTLDGEEFVGSMEAGEKREVLLWDLAGQPGYRLFHKLSLRDVAVGLIVFDARSESDPFRGVAYWAKALDESSVSNAPLVKLLVSARSDRGGIAASPSRVEEIQERHGIDRFHETSAKTGTGIANLIRSVSELISWDSLPIVAAPNAFVKIREFLVSEKRSGSLLETLRALESRFRSSGYSGSVSHEMFEVCLGRLEATGLVARISFGNRWLLQPEILDSYVAWLAHDARQEPDGLGAIDESRALRGEYTHDALPKATDEQAMLVTAVEEVVGRGLALRVSTDKGQMIVFPSELRTDLPDYPEGYAIEMTFQFEGDVAAIYAAISVKLINSLGFGTDYKLFKNAATFGLGTETLCGFAAHYLPGSDETTGRIVVFFGPHVTTELKLSFLRYIDFQLTKLAFSGSLVRERVYACSSCHYRLPSEVVTRRTELGHETLICPICSMHLPMDNLLRDAKVKDRRTSVLVQQAVHEQAKQQRLASYSLRRQTDQYHVFICYNSVDRTLVNRLDDSLKAQGVITWYDRTDVTAGDRHTHEIESVIDSTPCAIIAMGPNSLGPWQEQEYYALLQQAIARRKNGSQLRIIPVLLAGAEGIDELPPFLGIHSVIDLRGRDPGAAELRRLIDAILTPVRVRA